MYTRISVFFVLLHREHYIERVQSALQTGRPNNDLLIYLPVYDLWAEYPGRLIAPSGVTYGALVLPKVRHLPQATAARLASLEQQGATIIRVAEGEDYATALTACAHIQPNPLRLAGLSVIRRVDDEGKPFSFVANLTPYTYTSDSIQLFSGESGLLTLQGFERLSGLCGIYPATMDTLDLAIGNKVGYWSQEYPDSVGTGRYTLRTPRLKKTQGVLYLPEVRESAHVYVNGYDAGVIFAAPFMLDVSPYLKRGRNTIVVDVTSLAANRVAAMDRRGEKWRVFKDANIANLKGGKVSDYSHWNTMPCGLGNRVFLLQKP